MAKFKVGDKVRFKKNFTPPGRKTNERYCKEWGYDPEGVYEVISDCESIDEEGVWFRCKNIGHNQSDRFEKVEEDKKVEEINVGDLVRLKEGVTEKDFACYCITMGRRDSEEVFSRKPQKIADIRQSSISFRPWHDESGYCYNQEWFEKVAEPKKEFKVGDLVRIKKEFKIGDIVRCCRPVTEQDLDDWLIEPGRTKSKEVLDIISGKTQVVLDVNSNTYGGLRFKETFWKFKPEWFELVKDEIQVGDWVKFKKDFKPEGSPNTNEQYCRALQYDIEGVYQVMELKKLPRGEGIICEGIGWNETSRFEKVEAPKEPIRVGDWVKIKPGITDEQYRQHWLLWEEYPEIKAVKEGKVVRVSHITQWDKMKLGSVWVWDIDWFDKAEEPKVTQPEPSIVKPSPFHTIKNCYNCSRFTPTTNGEGHCDGTVVEKKSLISRSVAKIQCGRSWREKKPVGVGKNLFEGASATKETIHLTPPAPKAPKDFFVLYEQSIEFKTPKEITFEIDRENGLVVAFIVEDGKMYRGVAKCKTGDKWNELKGKHLAGARLLRKLLGLAEKRISERDYE